MGYGCEVTCAKTLPAVYDDSLTYYEQLCKLYAKLNEIIVSENTNAEDIAKLKECVKALAELLDEIASGKFDDTIRDEVSKWVGENVKFIFDTYAKQVFFGLTDDGHFCAYAPQSWSEISFDTGAVYGTEEYGRLILQFAADGQGVIDNRYDSKVLVDTVDALLDLEAGDGIRHEDGKFSVDVGANLRIDGSGKLEVPDADTVTKGAVKLSHTVENTEEPSTAVTPQGVYAYAQPKAQ